MPKLYEITDAYSGGDLPVEETVLPTDRPRVIINTAEFDKPKLDWDKGIEAYNSGVSDLKSKVSGIADAIKYASELDQKFTSSVLNFPKKAYENSDDLVKGLKNLFGLGEEERYQLWPEKVAREALTSAGDIAKPNPYPEGSEQWQFYENKRQEGMVPAAMAISALAGSGGLAGTGAKAGEVALGATPFLRPALKHKEKLYKGKPGQEHQDIIPKELYEDFRQKAMSGEDLAEYNFGFINDKGHFLDREKALEYGINTGLIDPQAGKYGALTSTLMADSSKPGVAIESLAKANAKMPMEAIGLNTKAGTYYEVLKNPSKSDILSLGKDYPTMGRDAPQMRVMKVGDDTYAWPATYATHDQISKSLGIKHPGFDNLDNVSVTPKGLSGGKKDWNILFADSSKPGTAIEAMAKSANPFYSAVEHTVKNISQDKMTGEQWLGTIANKPGVKGEELDWTGLKSFLEENKGKPVTKAQIEEHLAANKVGLKEVRKGGEAGTKEKAFELAKEHGWKSWDEIDAATQAKYMQRASREAGENPTKYHSYQLPGGSNYKEMLLTLPKQSDEQFIKAYEASTGVNVKQLFGRDPTSTEIANLRRNSAASEVSGEYKSSHWDEPNILAHVRMNDRNIDGKKSLHLEEVQSDWHQQGRDKGYKGQKKARELTEAEDKELNSLSWKNELSGADKARYDELKAIKNDYLDSQKGVPDAPFKKTWHELALKRMIREAAEKGYDRLSWTPGEAQAARYDLSKQIDKLSARPMLDQHGLKYEVKGWKGDNDHLRQVVTESELPNVVGKEMAQKIIKESEGKKPVEYKGLDLKIGGEGMKGFYDQIIPKSVNKIAKEYGVKVEKGKTSEGHDIFYIDLPEGLKNTALRKGFPLFSNVHPGYSFIPYAGNPFENEK